LLAWHTEGEFKDSLFACLAYECKFVTLTNNGREMEFPFVHQAKKKNLGTPSKERHRTEVLGLGSGSRFKPETQQSHFPLDQYHTNCGMVDFRI